MTGFVSSGGQAWSQLCGWKADGRDLPNLARLAKNDVNFRYARSVGVVLDVESNLAEARPCRVRSTTRSVHRSAGQLRRGTPMQHMAIRAQPRTRAGYEHISG